MDIWNFHNINMHILLCRNVPVIWHKVAIERYVLAVLWIAGVWLQEHSFAPRTCPTFETLPKQVFFCFCKFVCLPVMKSLNLAWFNLGQCIVYCVLNILILNAQRQKYYCVSYGSTQCVVFYKDSFSLHVLSFCLHTHKCVLTQ